MFQFAAIDQTTVETGIGKNLIDKLIELLDVAINTIQLAMNRRVIAHVLDHLHAEANTRHRGPQLMGHGTNHLLLRTQQTLYLGGHGIEGHADTANKATSIHLDPGIEMTTGDLSRYQLKSPQTRLYTPDDRIDNRRQHTQEDKQYQQQQGGRRWLQSGDRANGEPLARVCSAGNDKMHRQRPLPRQQTNDQFALA